MNVEELKPQIEALRRKVKEAIDMLRYSMSHRQEDFARMWKDELRKVVEDLTRFEIRSGIVPTAGDVWCEAVESVPEPSYSTGRAGIMPLLAKEIGVTVYPGTRSKPLDNDPETHVSFIRRDCTGSLERLMPCADPDIHEDNPVVPVKVYSHVKWEPPKPETRPGAARPMTERDMYERAVLETAVKMFTRDGFRAKGRIHWVPWKTRRKFKFREKVVHQFIKYSHDKEAKRAGLGGLGGKLIRRLIEGTTVMKPRDVPVEFFRRGRRVKSNYEPKYSCDWQQRKTLISQLKSLMESKRMRAARKHMKETGAWTVPVKPVEKVF